jgi:hypothetical protein
MWSFTQHSAITDDDKLITEQCLVGNNIDRVKLTNSVLIYF